MTHAAADAAAPPKRSGAWSDDARPTAGEPGRFGFGRSPVRWQDLDPAEASKVLVRMWDRRDPRLTDERGLS
jgi:hypothetical protein